MNSTPVPVDISPMTEKTEREEFPSSDLHMEEGSVPSPGFGKKNHTTNMKEENRIELEDEEDEAAHYKDGKYKLAYTWSPGPSTSESDSSEEDEEAIRRPSSFPSDEDATSQKEYIVENTEMEEVLAPVLHMEKGSAPSLSHGATSDMKNMKEEKHFPQIIHVKEATSGNRIQLEEEEDEVYYRYMRYRSAFNWSPGLSTIESDSFGENEEAQKTPSSFSWDENAASQEESIMEDHGHQEEQHDTTGNKRSGRRRKRFLNWLQKKMRRLPRLHSVCCFSPCGAASD